MSPASGRPAEDDRRDIALVSRLPSWSGSIRFRLAGLYSLVLFGIAAVVFGTAYFVLAATLAEEPVATTADLDPVVAAIDPASSSGGLTDTQQRMLRAALAALEEEANRRTLQQLRGYTAGGLLVFLVSSLCVGWLIAAWVLRPIDRITRVAREISATDLSQRIALGGAEDELRSLADTFDEMLARIDDAFEEQRRLIQEVSHELRNPIATIRTNLEVTLADEGATVDDLRHTAEVVDRSAERMGRLVDDLLLTARNEVPMLAREVLDVGAVVEESAEEFRGPADARGLRVEADVSGELTVIGDRLALKRCLANLLANAVRLAPEGSVIRLSAGRSGDWVWMNTEDEGPGISAEDQQRVFQRFWRANPVDRDHGRSGLGLTIVRQIAEAHGGSVELVSAPGVGSTFSIRLPAAGAEGGSAPQP